MLLVAGVVIYYYNIKRINIQIMNEIYGFKFNNNNKNLKKNELINKQIITNIFKNNFNNNYKSKKNFKSNKNNIIINDELYNISNNSSNINVKNNNNFYKTKKDNKENNNISIKDVNIEFINAEKNIEITNVNKVNDYKGFKHKKINSINNNNNAMYSNENSEVIHNINKNNLQCIDSKIELGLDNKANYMPINLSSTKRPINKNTIFKENRSSNSLQIKKLVHLANKEFDKNKEFNKLNFSEFELISSLLCNRCCINKKRKSLYKKEIIYKKCLDSVKSSSNIEVLIKNIKELEFIKNLLLNKDQILAFNYLGKPTIKYDNLENSRRLSSIYNKAFDTKKLKNYENKKSINNLNLNDIVVDQLLLSKEEKMQCILEYFKNKYPIFFNKKESIDYKMFEMLDENIKNSIYKSMA